MLCCAAACGRPAAISIQRLRGLRRIQRASLFAGCYDCMRTINGFPTAFERAQSEPPTASAAHLFAVQHRQPQLSRPTLSVTYSSLRRQTGTAS